MNIEFTKTSMKDFLFFKNNNLPEYKKIKILINDIIDSPFQGLGKPEKLKGNLSGYYSRRITKEHRLVYSVEGTILYIISCRYHYTNS